MIPNIDQTLSALRAVMLFIGTTLVNRGLVSTDTVELATGIVLAVIPVIWGPLTHTMNAKLMAVERMRGVKLVVDVGRAPAAAVQAALDETRQKVVES